MRKNRSTREAPKHRGGHWLWWTVGVSVLTLCAIGALIIFGFLRQFEQSLPSISSVADYHPPVATTVFAADGTPIAEFYDQRRYLTDLDQVPQHLVQAFLAAEDAHFFEHQGLDIGGIIRAFIKNIRAGEIVQGGSTITQQVVKSLLLSPERTWMRKLKEAVLAYRLDHALSKQDILYLYLNQIYLGSGAYGVEAAARIYFGKHVGQLDIAESALLAGLPKAPSRYSPFRNLQLALKRQHYVLGRMVENGFITAQQAEQARREQLQFAPHPGHSLYPRNYFVEEVRKQLENEFGHKILYQEGLQVYTTLDLGAQKYAEQAVDRGLRELDRRHGYRGPSRHVERDRWGDLLQALEKRNRDLRRDAAATALIVGYDKKSKRFRLNFGAQDGELDLAHSPWPDSVRKSAAKRFRAGDVIETRLHSQNPDGSWIALLDQEPTVEGALLAVEPATGRVLCMVGGRDFNKSQFNRAIQARRQPGSAFKPIIYAAALDKGYSPASVLYDSPIVQPDDSLKGPWKPANYDHRFLGPILLRQALIHSRNVVTIKLLDAVGIDYVIDYARRLGIRSPLTPTLSLALGASGVSLWELLTAYTAFANQGVRVEPHLIDSIRDRRGRLIKKVVGQKESVLSPTTAYLITDILEGVIQEGTGRRVRVLNRPAAGKTGTTNGLRDAWFVGYTPSVLTGVWVGHDDHRQSLGRRETGSRAASPIWLYFMRDWLKNKPVKDFPVPPDVVFARVNPKTGTLASKADRNAAYMAFAKGALPAAGNSQKTAGTTGSSGNAFFKSDLF